MNYLLLAPLVFLALRVGLLFSKLQQRFVGKPMDIMIGWRSEGREPAQGRRVACEYRVRSSFHRKSVSKVAVALVVPDRFRFRIQRETWFDRFAKRLGIAHEWQTHDPKLDSRLFVVSDDRILLEALSRSERLCNALLDLGSSNRWVLGCSHGRLWIEIWGSWSFDPTGGGPHDPDPRDRGGPTTPRTVAAAVAQQVVERLERIRDELATVAADLWQPKRDPGIRYQNALLAITLCMGLAGIVALCLRLERGMPRQIVLEAIVTRGVWITALSTGALCLLALALLIGRSRTHRVLLEILLVVAPSSWFVSTSLATWQNQHYDTNPPVVHELRVIEKNAGIPWRRHAFRRYRLTVEGWPDVRADRVLEVGPDLFDSVWPQACLRVTWHQGYLGDPWISSLSQRRRGCGRPMVGAR